MRFRSNALAFGLLVLLMFSYFPVQCDNSLSGEADEVLRYEVRDAYVAKITHSISIHNTGKHSVIRGELYVPLIRNVTTRHLVLITDIDCSHKEAPKILRDSYGNIYAWWNNMAINPKETFDVEIHYSTLSFSVRFKVDPDLVKPYDTETSVYERYTCPEKYVECDDPSIISTAQMIVAELPEHEYHGMAREIYDFVVNHLTYKLQTEEKGALWALKNRKGDCSEYSYLFVALCRAVGIPARVQAGFAFSSYTEETENGHMWAEYYLKGYGWIPVDASWKLFDKIDEKHFSSLQSIPEYISYANYEFNFTGNKPADEHLVKTVKTSITTMEDFTLAQKLFQAISEAEKTEAVLLFSKIVGAWLIFPYEYEKAEENFSEGELLLQSAIDSWNELSAEQSLEKLSAAGHIAQALVFNVLAAYVGAFLFIMVIVVVVILKWSKKVE